MKSDLITHPTKEKDQHQNKLEIERYIYKIFLIFMFLKNVL